MKKNLWQTDSEYDHHNPEQFFLHKISDGISNLAILVGALFILDFLMLVIVVSNLVK